MTYAAFALPTGALTGANRFAVNRATKGTRRQA